MKSVLTHIFDGDDYGPLLEPSEVERHRERWRVAFREMAQWRQPEPKVSAAFHTQWHVAHHWMRDLIADDALMLDVARVWLPPYEGPALMLLRGENIDRWEVGRVGFAWTEKMSTAEMFAEGLNAEGKGGVVIQAYVPVDALIAGTSPHSISLGESEYTVDVRRLRREQFLEICRYPPFASRANR